MKIRAEYRHFNFPYLYDGETQEVSNAFGVVADAPRLHLDKDANCGTKAGSTTAARIAGEDSGCPQRPRRPACGQASRGAAHAGIRLFHQWKSKIDSQMAETKMIESEPVKVDPVTAEELKTLRTNPTGKVLVVNFWRPGADLVSRRCRNYSKPGVCSAAATST